ncbi:DUF58 domain-containing protein [Pseudomonas citronellolis]|uniref:DUF58 domain-containing protein n=1 Tax=Pseudomonas citronellolis TaxID=53408 RepID=UPI0023E35F3E|nr:DUF58 domain-containing protein [Pseudomonas citronellolis]MDF3935576.1 DUF58 domain-containing protein [Pseudomonas citronellolis]
MSAEEGVYVDLPELLGYAAIARQMAISFPRVSQSLLLGNRPSRLNGRGGAFDQIRPYLQGDDVRDIDWKVTARMGGAPFVRVFNEERQRSLLLLVDQTQDMFFGTRTQLKSVLAARAAAQLMWLAHHRRQPCGLVVVGERQVDSCPPRQDRGHLIQAFEQLARANRALGVGAGETRAATQLPLALARLLRLVAKDAVVVLISDFHNVDEPTWRLVDELAARSRGLAIPIYDGILDNWPQQGQFLATYGGIEAELRFSPDAQRHGVEDRARRNFAALLARLAQAGLGQAPFSTYETAQAQLGQALSLVGSGR